MINIIKSLYYKIKFIINDKKVNSEIKYKLNNSFKYNHNNHNNFRNFATPCNFNHQYWS